METAGAPVRTATTAQLGGRVTPRNAPTTYHFEYGTQGSCDANPCQSTEPVSVGAGSVQLLVSEELTGLEPGTNYHYRLVAENGAPDSPSFGEGMTVTTRASEAPLSHGPFPGPPGSDRAYEMVSIPDSGGNPVGTAVGTDFSDDGNRAVYSISGGTPISETGSFQNFYFSEREASGWETRNITPPRGELVGANWSVGQSPADLSSINVTNLDEEGLRNTIWRLFPEDPPAKVFDVTPPTTLGTPGVAATQTVLYATESPRVLAALHPTGHLSSPRNFYDVTSGTPQPVSLLPGDVLPTCGVGSNVQSFSTATELSADGRFFVFPSQGSACDAPSRLYLRDLQAGTTELITPAPVSGLECGSGAALRFTADALFFWTKDRLSAEDSAPATCGDAPLPADGDFYRYDLGDGSLDCVTCVIPGFDLDVSGGTTNGSVIYFGSNSSTPLVPGATTGAQSTYVLDIETGELRWIGAGVGVGAPRTPNGSVVFFRSSASSLNPLGGATDNGGTTQLYRYDDRDRSLVCVSCPQDGSTPSESLVGSSVGSADGEIAAFATPTPLVSSDQNTPPPGVNPRRGTDVYEWRDGRLFLITDGLTDWPVFGEPQAVGISPSGRDLYFTAYAQYTPDALDSYNRLYDARIGGGFEYPEPPPPCPLEVCQGTPKGAPEDPLPSSLGFRGAGNAVPAPPSCVPAARSARRNARAAKRLRRRAKRIARRAKRSSNSKQMRQAKRLAKSAKRRAAVAKKRSRQATRCRKANRNRRSGR